MSKVNELFDWIVSRQNVRGSLKPTDVKNDSWPWLYDSAPPVAFNPATRVVMLEDGTEYHLAAKTSCKALHGNLKKQGELVLASLPLVYSGTLKRFQHKDVFVDVSEQDDESTKAKLVQ